MRNVFARLARRLVGFALFLGLVQALSLVASPDVQARSYYGPPYYTNYVNGNYDTVGAAVSAMVGTWQKNCPDCKLYVTYYDTTRDAASAAGVTSQPNTIAYTVYGTEYVNDPVKSAGGCNPLSGGNGGGGGSSPAGGRGEGAADAGMCPGSTFAGDPINTYSGNKYQQDTDYRSDGSLNFRRFYNSKAQLVAAHFGARWRHSYDRSAEIYLAMTGGTNTSSSFVLSRPDGSRETFVRATATAAWVGPADSPDSLTELTNSSGVTTGYAVFMGGPKEFETYSTAGALLSVTDLSGASTTLTYSTTSTPASVAPSAGLLLSITDPNGRSLTLTYDGNARISQLTLPDAGIVAYGYGSDNNLTSVTYPDGKSRQYIYNEQTLTANTNLPNSMTGLVDENGARFETTSYNSANQAISASFAGGVDSYTVAYDSPKVTTPLGQSTALGFTNVLGAIKVANSSTPCGVACNQPYQARTYDANGWPASFTDFRGNVTTTSYSPLGLELQRVDARGSSAQRTTTTTWDTTFRNPLTRTVANATGTIVAKSGWVYNARGQMLATCDMDPTVTAASSYVCATTGTPPAGVRRTVTTYCDAVDTTQCPRIGLPLTVDGPRTDVADITRYSYYPTTDESGCGTAGGACHHAGDLYQVTDPMGHVATVVAYDKAGRAARLKDANGVITDMTYTPRGWLASRTVRAQATGVASTGDATTTLTYDPTGTLHSVTDADGVTLTYGYDDAHRLIDVADGSGAHIHYTLDASGNPTKEETFDPVNVSRRSVSRTYNALGQVVSIKDGLGQVTFDATAAGSYDVDGHLVQAKDALGMVRQDTYDALNRIVASVANAAGTDAATKATTSAFAFDALDQLKSVTDPDGLVTTYSLDGLSNPTGLTSPDTGAQSSTFDAAGNALTQTDAKTTVSSQAFDALGRETSVSYTDSKLNVTFYYDEANTVTGCASSFPVGRLTQVVENAVTTVYCYDNQGRMAEQRQTQGTVTDTTDYVYTKAGRLAAIASPSGLVTEYGRDALGQITKVTVTPAKGVASTVVNSATYLPFGPVASYTLGNGQTVTRSYDANYRFTDVAGPAFNLHVARDAVGNIVALGNAPGASPIVETYTYDALYRLTGLKNASGATVEAYSYSKTGDRLTKTAPGLATGNYGYQSGTHQLTSIGTGSRTYDANGATTGNTSAGMAWGYGYNGRGQLIVLQQGGATVATYAYDASAHRIAKTVGSATTRFAYGPGGLLGEYGAASRDYVWMGDTPVAVVDGASVAFVHADGLNTPRAVTNAAGAVVWTWAYQGNPFGEQVPASTTGYALNLRFAGQYWDQESGFLYNIHRYYDSATGRYIQSDPIGLTGGINTYGYVSSNPLSSTDAEGLQEDTVTAYCAKYGAAACADVVAPNSATGAWSKIGSGVGGAALGAAATLSRDTHPDDDDDCGCGPDTRFEAYQKALSWAGMSIGNEGTPIPWSQYNGRGGINYTFVRQHGGSNYGYSSENGASVQNHPDGHPHQVGEGFPEHHQCPHFHATNSRAQQQIYPYKRGT
jgi:RHS repeat-associated protein